MDPMSNNGRTGRRTAIWAVVFAAVFAGIVTLMRRVHFDWAMFWQQLRHVRWEHIGLGILLIYATYWLRAMRWAEFCSATKKMRSKDLVGPQFVGFTAVALFGRLADLVRPYLLAKRTELPLSSQVAVYTIERMFDLGAAAVIFSGALAFTPRDLPHHDRFLHVGLLSLAATVTIAVFAVVVRASGEAVAAFARRSLGRLSAGLAASVAEKILDFRAGLNAVSTARTFLVAAAVSLAMWGMIGGAYVQTVHAFGNTPELASLSYSRTMLLMAASIGGSLLQLPGLGWFTQIAATAAAMQAFYGAPLEAATACGAMLLVVTSLSIVPAGLIFAQIEGVSLRKVASESGAAERAK